MNDLDVENLGPDEPVHQGLPFRSECRCICHEDESVSHIAPCCQPNPVGFIDLDIAPCGNGIYWADLAKQLATVWWEVNMVGGTLQHGDLAKPGTMFSVVLGQHGGQCFHGQTPMDAWKKAHAWLVSPERPSFERPSLSWAAQCDTVLTKLQSVIDSSTPRTYEEMNAIAERLVKMGANVANTVLAPVK